MTTYLLNSPVLTAYGEYSFSGPLMSDEARDLLAGGFISAIGHATAAEFLAQLLGINVSLNRVAIEMHPGDRAVVLRLKQRLPENRTLSFDEVQSFPSELGLLVMREPSEITAIPRPS
ncbi:MAG: DUF1874 domain-containing protein [Planctomycetota bacterium]